MTNSPNSGAPRRATGVLNAALAGTAQRAAFAPYLWDLAAERAGCSLEKLAASATAMVSALTTARQLVESDAIHVPLDDVASPAFEVLRRLSSMSREFDLVAVIPGPVELGALRGLTERDDSMDAFEDLARAVLEVRCDVLMVREPDPDPETVDSFRAMAKLAAFFGARTLVLGPPEAEFVIGAGFDGVDAGAAGPIAAGIPVAPASPEVPPSAVGIVTSSWSTPPRAADAEWLRRVARQIRTDRKE